jgi:outer membrane protein OmpA-like peptidoglycan-associated protein
MTRVSFLVVFVFLAFVSVGQSAKSLIDLGDKAFAKGLAEEAIAKYQAAEKLTPEDPKLLFHIGVAFLSSNRKYLALDYLEKAFKIKKDISIDIEYYLGHACQERYQFKAAIDHFESFKKNHKHFRALADDRIEQCLFAEELIKKPVSKSIKPLEYPVNSKYNDFAPLLDSGETTLIFTSARDSTQRDIHNHNQLFESVLFTEKIGGIWAEPKPLGEEINHHAHDAATYLSPDGSSLILYYGDKRDLFQSKYSEGYKSQHMNGVWTKAEPLPAPINSVAWESSGCFSPDGQFFFFASDRSEGYGELDIYMVKLDSDGKWGRPINLGAEVNTPANEDAPFMHADGTLYFGSEGHKGMGSYDIYKTRFKNSRWQTPENLGYPVNTPEYDNYFHLSSDKRHGYFTSVRKEGVGNTDIYVVDFPEEVKIDPIKIAMKLRADSIARADSMAVVARTNRVPDAELAKNAAKVDSLLSSNYVDESIKTNFSVATEFRGKVIDEVDGAPLKAQIILVDNKTNKLLTRANTNPKNGVFIIIIPHGGNFGLSANCEGYLFNSINFDVPAFAQSQTIETAIIMSRATVGAKSTLRNIFFDIGKADLKPSSVGELERVLSLLNKSQNLRVHINGHTDSNGDNAANKALSLKRAQAVVDYLIKKGISPKRLKAVGYGEERPLATNDDEEEGREINRRTEIEVVEITK